MNKPRTGKIINCLHCGIEFYIPKNRFATAKFCSTRCKGLHENNSSIKKCEVCGVEFTHISSRVNKAKYCSRKCYHQAMQLKGSIVVNCVHCGKEIHTSPSKNRKYCSKKCVNKDEKKIWIPKYTTVRKGLKKRGKITHCEQCGYSEEPRILGIHHKNKDRNNNTPENLIILCPLCHSLAHLKHIPQF